MVQLIPTTGCYNVAAATYAFTVKNAAGMYLYNWWNYYC
jgi:hypothetical protein